MALPAELKLLLAVIAIALFAAGRTLIRKNKTVLGVIVIAAALALWFLAIFPSR